MNSAKSYMRGPTYRYNAQTCRYERTRISFSAAFSYAFGTLITSALMLFALLLGHDLLFDTENEMTLRKENAALVKHHVVLSEGITEVEEKLQTIESREKEISLKLFGNAPEDNSTKNVQVVTSDLLVADANGFRSVLKSVEEKSTQLIEEAVDHNNQASATTLAEYFADIPTIPLMSPIKEITADKIVTGYGDRINPFHKGVYRHEGIDIAIPRLTEVLAPSEGKVITAKKSDLQAGYGNYIEVDHGNGYVTRYAHLDEIKVKVNQKIKRGDVIGLTGNSGGSVAPHLHYEIIRNGKSTDPISYLIYNISTTDHEAMKQAAAQQNQSLD